MNSPRVSVVMPFLNARSTIVETLESIMGQTWRDFELVAVDDGSTDGSAELLEEAAGGDPRLRLYRPGHAGIVGAMNFGLGRARGEYVARMDADDRMHPERLEHQVRFLDEHPKVGLVGSRVRLFPEALIAGGFREYVRWQNACVSSDEIAADIYIELPIANPTTMFRRRWIVALGGYRDGDFPEDYELMLRLHHEGIAMAKLPQVLLEWRESPGRATRTDPRYSTEAFDRVRAAYMACDRRLHGERPLAIWGAGRRTRRRVDFLLEYGFRPDVWVDIDPRKIGRTFSEAPVVGPDWLRRDDRPLVLSYVTNRGARQLICKYLDELGYRRGEDYLLVG
jgi:glycosyltransferase involved in cell wall biosynthesis